MKYCSLQSEKIAGMTLHMKAKQKHIQKQRQCAAMSNQYPYCFLQEKSVNSCWNENNVYQDISLSN